MAAHKKITGGTIGERVNRLEQYYLMDLERTIANNKPYYWKGNRHGYTDILQHAGLFSKDFAEKLVKQDFDKTTIMISVKTILKVLGKDIRQHEGITS